MKTLSVVTTVGENLKVALVGNPNSGKTTLFNALTGLNQKTGNFPGVTVEKKTGIGTITNKLTQGVTKVEYIDLPGAYSLNPISLDEKIASDIIVGNDPEQKPDIFVIVLDASSLKRSLFVATQIIDLGKPCIIALNMLPLLKQQGKKIDIPLLQNKLGVPVVAINPRKNDGVDDLKGLILEGPQASRVKFVSSNDVNLTNSYLATSLNRYKKIDELLSKIINEEPTSKRINISDKIDTIVTHRVGGYIIFLLILFVIFQSVFSLASYPMDWLETTFGSITQWCLSHLPTGELTSLLCNGILPGISGVLIFVPQIAFLFLFLGLLEETGYMARVSFIMDKIMSKLGLNGKSIIPLVSGMACAVPAIMGARTISNTRERLATIFLTPFMSCSARLPVYTLIISVMISPEQKVGSFNMQGVILMALYLLGILAVVIGALILKFTLKTREKSYFLLELPVYRLPQVKSILFTVWDKIKVFVFEAGKIIIAISIVLWMLSSHAPGNRYEEIETQAKNLLVVENGTSRVASTEEKQSFINEQKLENSYAGILGHSIEPIIKPLGFDWKIGIALITSFAAREVFVGTLSTIYSVNDPEDTRLLREKLVAESNTRGQKVFSTATCTSLLIFYAFAMQCMSTLAVVKRETKGWKWPLLQLFFMSGLAYICSLIVYQLLN